MKGFAFQNYDLYICRARDGGTRGLKRRPLVNLCFLKSIVYPVPHGGRLSVSRFYEEYASLAAE